MTASCDLVLFGDSITFAWPNPDPGRRLNRGIPGETAVGMQARFERDVLAHRPRLVHVMAGTNDVAENDGGYDEAATVAAIAAMGRAAQDAGIDVLLAAVPPTASVYWNPDVPAVARIAALNAALAALAAREGWHLVDYGAALGDGHGGMRAAFADDGLHPNAAGYAAMEPVLMAAVDAASFGPA